MEEYFSEEEVEAFMETEYDEEDIIEIDDDSEAELHDKEEDDKKKKKFPFNKKKEVDEKDKKKKFPFNKKEEDEKEKKKAKAEDDEDDETDAGDTYHNRLSPSSPHNKSHKKIAKKCRKCGSTSNIDLYHTNNSRKNLNSTKGIIPLCRKCHRKLHQGKGNSKGYVEEFKAVFDEVFKQFEDKESRNKEFPNFSLTGVATEIIDPEEVDKELLAEAKIEKQKDLMYVAFKLVHEGTNRNRDTFIESELKAAIDSPKLKSVNWGHTNENIGVIYDTQFVEATEEEPAHILAAAAIWKAKHKERAREMLERFAQGKLFFSMETFFEDAECSACHKTFGIREGICSHLSSRFSALSTTSRILRGLTFGGSGVVEEPADPLAVGLALASKKKEQEMKSKGVKLMDEKEFKDELAKAETATKEANDKVDEVIKSTTTEKEKLETKVEELTVANKTATDELEKVKKTLAETQEQLEASTKENETMKEAAAIAAAETKAQERCEALAELGYGPEKEDEAFAEYFEKVKNYTDETYTAIFDALKQSAKADVNDETKDLQKAEAKKLPAGDTSTAGKGDVDLPFLRKILEAAPLDD